MPLGPCSSFCQESLFSLPSPLEKGRTDAKVARESIAGHQPAVTVLIKLRTQLCVGCQRRLQYQSLCHDAYYWVFFLGDSFWVFGTQILA